jgi:hypothetical protein
MAVDLESVPQTGLNHTITALHLEDEALNVGVEVFVDFEQVSRHDGTQQHPTESGNGVGR